jgi:glucose-1-phosphate cytidylyltransferase
MKVVILCGGQGTRLREETEFRPKTLVEVGGRPILWHIMKRYAAYGFREFILCLGYQGNMIKDYFLNYEAMNNDFTVRLGKTNEITYHGAHSEQDFQVTLVNTGLETQTGARIKRIEPFIKDDTFMVTYGDGVSDLDFGRLQAFHRSHGGLATVTAVRPVSRFGVVDLDGDSRVISFSEKPKADGWISAGFFVFNRGVFDYIGDGDGVVMENDPLRSLSQDSQLVAYRHDGFFYAMDTYREYLHLNQLWNNGDAPWATAPE